MFRLTGFLTSLDRVYQSTQTNQVYSQKLSQVGFIAMHVAFSTGSALLLSFFSSDYGDLDMCGKVLAAQSLPMFREFSEFHEMNGY